MVLPLYLAMTAAEIGTNTVIPNNLAYMACHFSPYGTGLCNLPSTLPEDTMLILNDRIPICGHDTARITEQLCAIIDQNRCSCLLLDFQRPGIEAAPELARIVAEAIPCPVGISDLYAEKLNCPVFLPPVPLDEPLAEYLAPWQGREIWLEAAHEGKLMTLTESGCATTPLPYPDETGGQAAETLHCHYRIDTSAEAAVFTLFRTEKDLTNLLSEAAKLGVTQAVGLWQELGKT